MTLFSRKQLIRQAIVAGAILAGAVATSPLRAADDLPLVDDIQIDDIRMPPLPQLDDRDRLPAHRYERPYPERPYRPGPFGAGPSGAIPSARLERPLDARPVLPPAQVVTVLRARGYSPLGQMTQRGWVYTIAALDPGGEDGRLIIDARTGRIMQFVPAMEVDVRLGDRMAMVYGPPGPPPPTVVGYETRRGSLLDLRRLPRPPVAVPRAAQRPGAKAASRATPSAPAVTTAPAQHVAAPSAEPPAMPKAAPTEKTVENTVARTTVGAAARPSAPQPATLQLWPTQAMPDVQTLE